MKNDLVIVVGCKGMLGSDLTEYLRSQKCNVLAIDKEELDITKEFTVYKFMEEHKPYAVVNCAAYTDVACSELNVDEAMTVNGYAVGVLARATDRVGARLIHFSTDYVFDGKKQSPYVENDETRPLNVYGISKLAGENYCIQKNSRSLVLRVQWLWGRNGNSFVKKVLNRVQGKEVVKVVSDQFGCPTSTLFVSKVVGECLARKEMNGVYHVANDDFGSWYDFAKEALIQLGYRPDCIESAETTTASVIRPMNSRLDNKKIKTEFGLDSFGSWREEMRKYFDCYGRDIF